MTTTYNWATDTTTVTSLSNVDLIYPVTRPFVVITTLLDPPREGSAGIKVTDGGTNNLWFSYGPQTGPSVINITNPVPFIALEWGAAGTYTPYFSLDGVFWSQWEMPLDENGVPLPYPAFPVMPTQAGLFLAMGGTAEDSVVFGSPRVLPGYLMVTTGDGQWVIPEMTEDLKPIGTVPATQPPPVSQSSEAVVHALVGAPFGDLEFDVGKSVGWLARFVDDLFVTDVNSGNQRYWVVNWTKSFQHTYYRFSGLNYFTDPVAYRKGQVNDAFAYAAAHEDELVYDDNDWVIFLDAHEGLSTDTRSKPDDYLIAPYKSYMYREIARANAAGRDYVVLPFYVFLRHDHIQNASHSYQFEDESFVVTQSVGVPYYLEQQGLTRMFKVSALKNPAFNWALLDTPVPFDVKAGTGAAAIPVHLNPVVGTVSTPHNVNLNLTSGTQYRLSVSAQITSMTGPYSTLVTKVLGNDMNYYLFLTQGANNVSIRFSEPTATTYQDILTRSPIPYGTAAHTYAVDFTPNTTTVASWYDGVKTVRTAPSVIRNISVNAPVVIGNNVTSGRIFWAQLERLDAGGNPVATVWRFDPAERTGTGTSYTDPRGRTWTLTNANAIVPAVEAIPAEPAVKAQVVNYAYAHWNLQDIPPEETRVPPLSAENDLGWKQRCYMTSVIPIAGLPTGNLQDPVGTWADPEVVPDPVGLRGPWCFDVYADKVTGAVIPSPPPPVNPAVSGIMTPMYDLVFRINVRDGVWYGAGGTGNTQLIWNDTLQDWIEYGQPVPT